MELAKVIQQIQNKFPDAFLREPTSFLVIRKERWHDVAAFLKAELGFNNCHCVSGVDRKDHIEVVFHLYSFMNRLMVPLKVTLAMDDVTVETVSDLWKSANWLEREVYDLFGVKFVNHPDLRRILNPDEWTDFPLRKNFQRADFIKKPETLGLKGGA